MALESCIDSHLRFAYASTMALQAVKRWRAPMLWWPDSLREALLLMTGKGKHCGKNKRLLKPANHGKRPCNHTARQSKRPRRSHYNG
jgi:hypothetical protein